MEKKEFIEAGRIINTHGVAGEVKIEVWLDSPKFFKSFKTLYLKNGEELKVLSTKTHKGFIIAKLEGIDDINAAMRLKGKDVSIRRSDAALPRGAFFIHREAAGLSNVMEQSGPAQGKGGGHCLHHPGRVTKYVVAVVGAVLVKSHRGGQLFDGLGQNGGKAQQILGSGQSEKFT